MTDITAFLPFADAPVDALLPKLAEPGSHFFQENGLSCFLNEPGLHG
jgi:hypothetical protein